MKKIYPTDLILALIALIVITGSYTFNSREHTEPQNGIPLAIDTSSYVTLGNENAPLHLILLEEFSCQGCKLFHEEVIPSLISDYIETDKMKLTIIPLAFLDASKEAFVTSQFIHQNEPTLYLEFLNMLYKMPQEQMLKLKMKNLITFFYNDHPEFNLTAAMQHTKLNPSESMPSSTTQIIQRLFGDHDIEVPALILNGEKINYINKESLLVQIEKELNL